MSTSYSIGVSWISRMPRRARRSAVLSIRSKKRITGGSSASWRRKRAGRTQLVNDLQSLDAGHHDSEDDHIGRMVACERECFLTGGCGVDNKAIVRQPALECAIDYRIVVNDQDSPFYPSILVLNP